IFDHKQHRKFSFLGKTNRFEKIALARGGVADSRDDDVFLSVQLNTPGHSARGKKLRARRSWHTPNVKIDVAVMRRHHAAAAAGVALGEIFKTELARCHSATKNKAAIAIKWNNVIARIHLH